MTGLQAELEAAFRKLPIAPPDDGKMVAPSSISDDAAEHALRERRRLPVAGAV